MLIKSIQCEGSAYYKLCLLYLLEVDPFSIIRLLDLLTSPLFEPYLTVPLDTMLALTYDLLPLCPPHAFLEESKLNSDYETNLLLISNQALRDFLGLLNPDVISLS